MSYTDEYLEGIMNKLPTAMPLVDYLGIIHPVTGRVSSKIQPAPTDQQTEPKFFELLASEVFIQDLTSMRRDDVPLEEFVRALDWVIVSHCYHKRMRDGGSNPL